MHYSSGGLLVEEKALNRSSSDTGGYYQQLLPWLSRYDLAGALRYGTRAFNCSQFRPGASPLALIYRRGLVIEILPHKGHYRLNCTVQSCAAVRKNVRH